MLLKPVYLLDKGGLGRFVSLSTVAMILNLVKLIQGRFQGSNRTGAQFEKIQMLGIRIFNLIQNIPNFYLKSEI